MRLRIVAVRRYQKFAACMVAFAWTGIVMSGLACGAEAADAPQGAVHLRPLGRFDTGVAGSGAAEIVAYHAASKLLFSVNTHARQIDVVSIASPEEPRAIAAVKLADFGSLPTSVACRSDVVATSVLAKNPQEHGRVIFFTPTGEIVGNLEVGYHPDMVMFSPDGRYLVVANEGEPTSDGTFDGEGSITIITVPRPIARNLPGNKVATADFSAWNDEDQPLPEGMHRIDRTVSVAQDIEPEGITFAANSRTAYVTLQEANGVAVVNLATAKVERILGLGTKDHSVSGNELDVQGQGNEADLRTVSVLGLYQPDNIGRFSIDGRDYLALANEGDLRITSTLQEELLLRDATLDAERFPNAAELQTAEKVGNLYVSSAGDTDGDGDLDQLWTFGGRSLSIIDIDGKLIYESGSLVEKLIAERLKRQREAHPDAPPKYGVKKGPEPEGLAVGVVAGRTYTFLGLERDNGIVTFDVTDPLRVEQVDYVNPGEQQQPAGIAQDAAPEGLCFISAKDSPNGKPLLAVANEASGSVTLYQIVPGKRP